jgi:ribosomal protein S18 acetylase RimI-like enzyme
MVAIELRVLHQGDEGVLANVAEGVFDETIKPELAAAYLAEPRFHMVVALDGQLVVGMATGLVHFHPDKGPEFFVNEVGVGDDYLRRGIGKRLVRAILAQAKAAGCTEAWLGTEADNVAALALYRSVLTERDREEPMVVFTFRL